jgi:hypothetical protein
MRLYNIFLIALPVMSTFVVGGCRKDSPPSAEKKPSEEEKKESVLEDIDVATSDFNNAASDGRGVAFSDWADIYSKIDFTRLHPKTQQFYQTSSQTAVNILIEPDRQEILWKFSNFQDSVAVTDVIAGVKRACTRENFTSIKACLDDAIAKSGAVVFEMKQKLGNPLLPNDENHIRDALYGLLGATFINSPVHTGGTELRMTTSCAACHNAVSSKLSGSNTTLFVDLRGDNSYSDVLSKRDAMTSWAEFKNYVANPADPIWATSAETKAAGYMAAQYMKLKDQYAHQYGYDEDDIRTNAHKANIKSVVDSGWVSAFANWITTARAWSGVYPDEASDDLRISKVTEKATALNILQTRSNLLQPWSVLAPFRAQRSVVYAPSETLLASRSLEAPANFALDYMKYRGNDRDPRVAALPYLLSATSISLVFPGVEDAVLSQAWYGTTPAGADAIVKRELPRTIMKNYLADASMYHQARYIIPLPVPKTHVQTINIAEVNLGYYVKTNTCVSCHVSPISDLSTTTLTANCFGKAECVSRATNAFFNSATYAADTPASLWAGSVMNQMGTAPEAFNLRYYISVIPNTDIKAKPANLPLLRRQALGLWTYNSYATALLPNAQRPGAGYGVLSSRLSLDRTVPFRKVALTFDFDGNGTIGQEDMYCLQSKMFDLDRNGTAETSCFDALQTLSGGTPRPIGKSDASDFHAGVVSFPTTTADRSALAKVLAAYADGAFNVRWSNGTTTFVKLVPYDIYAGCVDLSDCGEGTWKGFKSTGGTGSDSGGGAGGSGGLEGPM